MSVYGIEKAMYLLKRDKALAAAFKASGAAALPALPLEENERAALASGDLASLYRMGVHPLLLAPYSRMMGIPRPKYQAALDPLRGSRKMKSID